MKAKIFDLFSKKPLEPDNDGPYASELLTVWLDDGAIHRWRNYTDKKDTFAQFLDWFRNAHEKSTYIIKSHSGSVICFRRDAIKKFEITHEK